MMLRLLSSAVALGLAGSMLAGCTADTDELSQWMEQQRREVKPSVPPLMPPKKFDPEPYASAEKIEPFSPQKLSLALKQVAQQSNSLLTAEQNRRKEALEAYPLDDMKMVGSLMKQGQPYALVKVNDLLYQVKVGDHLGQNNGRVTKISETEITLREVVQDDAGEGIERTTTLQLQEKAR